MYQLPQILVPLATKAGWLAVVIVLDLALGVIVALKQHRFEWQRLADFLGDYGPKIAGWLALEVMDFLPGEYKVLGGLGAVLGAGAFGLLFLSAAASVLGHVQAIGVLPANLSGAGLPPTRPPEVTGNGETPQ